MTAVQLVSRPDVAVYHATHIELLEALPRREDGTVCDLLAADCPYSPKTHAGHDDGTARANRERPEDLRRTRVGSDGYLRQYGTPGRRTIDYGPWTDDDVAAFVEAWSPVTRGWLVSVTDHVLAPTWAAEMERAGRYVFAPMPFVAPGSRVRLAGDGPSTWTCWIVVGRPRTPELARWGTLPGAYVLPPGHAERMPVVGGKPVWLMERLCEDYSRPGDLIVDPCCGGASTLLGALHTGRRAIGGDASLDHARIAASRVDCMVQAPLFAGGAL